MLNEFGKLCLVGYLVVTVGCTEQATEETATKHRSVPASATVQRMMTEEGCRLTPGCWTGGGPVSGVAYDGDLSLSTRESTAPDPSPGADGLWLGIRSTDCYLAPPFNASASGHLDIDDDRLDDGCEYVLANAFAPMLAIDDREQCIGGEPYWAAKYIDNLLPYNTGDMVKLAYLPSYHNDCGTGPHAGDSEFIQLTVGYNPSTQHWEVINSWLSGHVCPNDGFDCQLPWNSLGDSQSWGRTFEWPAGRPYTFPRIFISKNKHANYRSLAACNSGGFLYSDTCEQSRDRGRFVIWQSHNIGSGHQPVRDCVETETSLPLTAVECFWTGTKFRGWKSAIPGVTPYKTLLLSVVFQGTQVSATTWWTGSYGY